MKRLALKIMAMCLVFLGMASCGGSGGSSPGLSGTVTLNGCTVSPLVFKKSASPVLTLGWSVDTDAPSYTVDVYLSRDAALDANDTLILHTVSYSSSDSVTLDAGSSGYNALMDAYGGYYYLIFDAYTDSGHSQRFIPGFELQVPWSLLIYMDGDNSLSSAVDADMNELAVVGSNSMVNAVVEVDTSDSTTKRYFIEPFNPVLLSDLGELNMADKKTLEDFIGWATANYPADHYLLVLWNHGQGFENAPTSRDILWDDHPVEGLSMSIPELSEALSASSAQIGKKIDVVGMDACLMSMLEIAYSIRGSADYMVASENLEPVNGWPYDRLLQFMETDPANLIPQQLSASIVDMFVDSYTDTEEPSLSAVDLGKIGQLAADVSNLAGLLIQAMSADPAVKYELTGPIYDNVQRFDDNNNGSIDKSDSYADLYNLAELINRDPAMSYSIQAAATDVMGDIGMCVLRNAHKGAAISNAHGLSIWYPDGYVYDLFKEHYSALSFARETEWLGLIDMLNQ